MMIEQWRPVPDWVNYEVSDQGRVRSIDRLIAPGKSGKKRFRKGKIITPHHDKDGYLQCMLGAYHPIGLTRKVHRLVMLVFKGPSELGVNHKDGNKTNNSLGNLEYSTHSENHIHARKVLKKLIGKSHWNYKHGRYAD